MKRALLHFIAFLAIVLLPLRTYSQHFMSKFVNQKRFDHYPAQNIYSFFPLANDSIITLSKVKVDTASLRLHTPFGILQKRMHLRLPATCINNTNHNAIYKARIIQLNNRLYINSMDGLHRFTQNLDSIRLITHGILGDTVTGIRDMIKLNNVIYLATEKGLYRFNGKVFWNLNINITKLRSLHSISENEFAIATENGIYLYSVGSNSIDVIIQHLPESPLADIIGIYRISDGSYRLITGSNDLFYSIHHNQLDSLKFHQKLVTPSLTFVKLGINNFIQLGDEIYFTMEDHTNNNIYYLNNLFCLNSQGEFIFHTMDGLVENTRKRAMNNQFTDFEYFYDHFYDCLILYSSFQKLPENKFGVWVKYNNGRTDETYYCILDNTYLYYTFNNNHPFSFMDGSLDVNDIRTFSNGYRRHFESANQIIYGMDIDIMPGVSTAYGIQNKFNNYQKFSAFSNLLMAGFNNDNKIRKLGNARLLDVGTNSGPILHGQNLNYRLRKNEKYRRTWKINKHEIDQFIVDYSLGLLQQPAYKIHESILSWPGNTEVGSNSNMAPYVDVNGDGIYNPYDGDYPEISGDQMIYFVYNDLPFNPIEDTVSMGMEVHCTMYAYKCKEAITALDSAVTNQTIFTKYRIINKSNQTYTQTFLGSSIYAHNNGFRGDNKIGSRPDKNMAFTWAKQTSFNSTENPVYGLIFLNGPLAEPNDGLDNDNNGIVDEPGEQCLLTGNMLYHPYGYYGFYGSPYTPEHVHNFLNARWQDGTPLVRGGIGYQTSTEITRHIFDGAPFCSGEWNDCAPFMVGIHNRRGMISSAGPFTISPNQEITFEFAEFMYYQNVGTLTHTHSWPIVLSYADLIREKFNQQTFAGCFTPTLTQTIKKPTLDFQVFPNPGSDEIHISLSHNARNYIIRLLDMQGRVLIEKQSIANEQITKLDVKHLSAGPYLICVVSKEQSTGAKIWLKQ